MKPGAIVAAVLVAAAAGMFVFGSERTTFSVYCHYWHLMNDSPVHVGNISVAVPKQWCPRVQEPSLLALIMVPPSRNSPLLAVAFQSIPDELRGDIRDPPTTQTVLGEPLRLVGRPITRQIGTLSAYRIEYERANGADDLAIWWFFPEIGMMASSFSVAPGSGADVDALVAGLKPRSVESEN